MRPLSSRWIAAVLALGASALCPPDARANEGRTDAAVGDAVSAPGMLLGFGAALQRDPDCDDQTAPRQQRKDRRPTGPLAWLFRLDRDHDLERSGRPFAFYLRSPLLSGLYGCPPQSNAGARTPEPVDECAELTITTEAAEDRTIQVLLPQYEATNVRRLRSYVDDRLRSGHVVTLIMTGGEPFSIRPSDTSEITAKTCRRGVWNE